MSTATQLLNIDKTMTAEEWLKAIKDAADALVSDIFVGKNLDIDPVYFCEDIIIPMVPIRVLKTKFFELRLILTQDKIKNDNKITGGEDFGASGLQHVRQLASLFLPKHFYDSEVSALHSKYLANLTEKKLWNLTHPPQQQSNNWIPPRTDSSPEVIRLQAELREKEEKFKERQSRAKSRKAAQAMKIQNIRDHQIPQIRSLMAQLYGTVQPMDSATVSGTHDKAMAKLQTFVRLTKKMPLFYTAKLATAACEIGKTVTKERLSLAIEAAYYPVKVDPPETVIQFFMSFIRVNLGSFTDCTLKQLPSPLGINYEVMNFQIPWMDGRAIAVAAPCVESLKTQLRYIEPSIEKYFANARVLDIIGKAVEDYIRVGFQIAVCQSSLSLLDTPVKNGYDPSYTRDEKFESADKSHVEAEVLQTANFVVIPGLFETGSDGVFKCLAMAKTLD
ncbi:hypothetical protein HDU84_009594 [Entophlyctis sp. JEL0112]|nr:hypothetical protein HDU84_009594 [Entophlyctis sp. JEL0112]